MGAFRVSYDEVGGCYRGLDILGGCANLPPILERWADLEIAPKPLYRRI